jgi:hypothetical protein
MKTEQEIKQQIKAIESGYSGVLTGTMATVDINAPRALMQFEAESRLRTLHWVLGTTYNSRLKGWN